MNIELKPTSSRFKRLIHDFGKDWEFVTNPRPMPCFNGEIGITAFPTNGKEKLSNFKLVDVEILDLNK